MKKPTTLHNQLIKVGQTIAHRGWVPATSGNFSVREAGNQPIWITSSGRDKGALTDDQLIAIDANGNPLPDYCTATPSAETLLHTQIYQHFHEVNAVLHTHSPAGVLLSKLSPAPGTIQLRDYELLKAFPGIRSHTGPYSLPVYANEQHMPTLARHIEPAFKQHHTTAHDELPAYLIQGHGLYTWAHTLQQAMIQLDALEAIMQCEAQLRLSTQCR